MNRFDRADAIVAPLALFFGLYLATFAAAARAAQIFSFWYPQWIGLFSVAIATFAIVLWWESGRWPIGFASAPKEVLVGFLFAIALVGACDLLVLISTDIRHGRGSGFPWSDVAAIFLPAAIHEELLFRGYPFQKLLRWRRIAAYAYSSIVFAALHWSNTGISALALLNIFLAGILLALAYERYQRLWFPIGIHLAWNVLSGPVLGHEVSGYVASSTVLTSLGNGDLLFTGGDFGIEGTVWMTLCELGGIVALRKRVKGTA